MESDPIAAIRQIVEDGLSSSARELVREALWLHIRYEQDESPSQAVTEINQMFLSGIQGEALRRFARGEVHEPKTKEDLVTIISFLTHPSIECLRVAELKISTRASHVFPSRMTEFFHKDWKKLPPLLPGRYFRKSLSSGHDTDFATQLKVHKAKHDGDINGVILSICIGDVHEKDYLEEIDVDDAPFIHFSGWAIQAAAGTIFVAVSDDVEPKTSRIYVSLTPYPRIDEEPVSGVMLLQLDRIATMGCDRPPTELVQRPSHFLDFSLYFQHVAEFSGSEGVIQGTMKSTSDGSSDKIRSIADLAEERRKRRGDRSILGKKRSAAAKNMDRRDVMDDKTREERQALGKELLEAAKALQYDRVVDLLKRGADVNYVEPSTGCTAFHFSAKFGHWAALEAMLATGECNLLHRDHNDHRTSWFAAAGPANAGAARSLMKLEEAQAKEAGLVPGMYKDKPANPGPELDEPT